MRRVDRERVNIRRAHTRRGNMKRVKIWRKRNEKHKVKNEEEKRERNVDRKIFLLTRNINKKENKFQGEKGICFVKN